MGWTIQQRTAEIGVQMALDAQRSAVMWMVAKQGAICPW
jgi:hypothetical protein